MTYSLIELPPGAYDLSLNDEVMGSIVRTGHRSSTTMWTAELLEDLPKRERPIPFSEVEHHSPTSEALCEWLGNPEVKSHYGRRMVSRNS